VRLAPLLVWYPQLKRRRAAAALGMPSARYWSRTVPVRITLAAPGRPGHSTSCVLARRSGGGAPPRVLLGSLPPSQFRRWRRARGQLRFFLRALSPLAGAGVSSALRCGLPARLGHPSVRPFLAPKSAARAWGRQRTLGDRCGGFTEQLRHARARLFVDAARCASQVTTAGGAPRGRAASGRACAAR